jgi:ribosomal protein L40E
MRGGVVAAGVALIIVGTIFFYLSNTTVAGVSGQGGGVVGYKTETQIFLMIGVVLGIVGFVTLIAGLAASKKEKLVMPRTVVVHPSAAPKEPETLVICPECDARVSAKSSFCPKCGANLKPKRK